MRNLKTYFNHKKEFRYFSKIRYAQGVGDVIAAILHSKVVGPITYLVTGLLEPCGTCQNRRTALNLILPIPIWKLFFKTEDIYNDQLNKDFKKIQGDIGLKTPDKPLEDIEKTIEEIKNSYDVDTEKSNNSDDKPLDNTIEDFYKDYFLISENRTDYENVLIVNRIYKKL